MATVVATVDERKALIDQYVLEDALNAFLVNLTSENSGGLADAPFEDISALDGTVADAVEKLGSSEFMALWGCDEDDCPPRLVVARTLALVAEMFAAVAARPNYCAMQARHFAALVRTNLEREAGDA
jgi:hypothetical protein